MRANVTELPVVVSFSVSESWVIPCLVVFPTRARPPNGRQTCA